MNTYFTQLIDLNLFPKTEYKSSYIIELTEQFIKALFEEYKRTKREVFIDITKFRQVIYGLVSIKRGRTELVEDIKTFLSKNHDRPEINIFVGLLKKEKIFVEENIIIKNCDINLISTDLWQEIINSDFQYSAETFRTINKKSAEEEITQISPLIIKSKLDNYYFGPDSIKEEFSRIFYEHLINSDNKNAGYLPKRNTLIMGPSGCGKTYIVNTIAKFLNYPFITYDVTKMSRTGYVGDKIEDILSLFFSKTGSVEKMKKGIIFLDEIDKLAANLQYGSAEISSTGVQYELLKFIEGEKYCFSPSGHRDYERKSGRYEIDSTELLIIGGGAFTGIDKIIETRIKKHKYGFVSDNESLNINSSASVEDLIEYGLIKEFAARFHIIISMPERNVEDLYNILVNSENCLLNSYIEYFKYHDCKLLIEDDALWEIAEYSYKQKTGARGLVRILEKVLPMYSIGNREHTIFELKKEIVKNKMNYIS